MSLESNIISEITSASDPQVAETPRVLPFQRSRIQQQGSKRPWCYKVPHRQREVNEKAYEPNVISIGPYHHGKQHLQTMEAIKRSCFHKFLEKTRRGFDEVRAAMSPLEPVVRECYEQPLRDELQDPDRFVEMMIYDGCFIVQLIRKIYPEDDIFYVSRIQNDILSDLLLLENQIPFFVIFKLYRTIVPNAMGDFHTYARLALSNIFHKEPYHIPPNEEIIHLLSLMHSGFHPSPRGKLQHEKFNANAAARAEGREPGYKERSWKFIRSATELEDAGISFFGNKFLDINFTKDTKQLRIPTLAVSDTTERYFRNLMAHEQFLPHDKPTYVVDYAVFMDNLINTGKDVQLLCKAGIIDNWLGDDEAVAQMFNKLRDPISGSQDFCYAEIFGRINQHCERKWNKWMAALKKNYFNTPWSLISFLAAVFLLLLTLLQTIFSVLAYFNS